MASASASPRTTRELMDALTAHLSLYHAAANPSPASSSSSSSSQRGAILRWLGSLSPAARAAAATSILSPAAAAALLSMLRRLRLRGHSSFFVLHSSSSPSTSSAPARGGGEEPTVLSRLSRGLLARAAAGSRSHALLFGNLLLFPSSPASSSRCPDAITVAEAFLADLDGFVAAMDEISGGRFLCSGEVEVDLTALACQDFPELPWLDAKGYYVIEEFVANRLEIALRMSWAAAGGGGVGGRKTVRVGKSVKEKAGLAANAFWREKGYVDWWMRLEPRMRARIMGAFFGKGAVALANEMVEGSDIAWDNFSSPLALAATAAGDILVKLRGLLMVVSTESINLELIGDGAPKKKDVGKNSGGSRKGKKKSDTSKKLAASAKPSKMQSSAWSGFPAQLMHRGGICSDSDIGDDTESYWFSEEESDSRAHSGRDINQYFGGGVMYWSPAEHAGTGFSRPPSLSSDDSAWAWHEADVIRVVDDLANGIPSTYTNGVSSPPSTPSCSQNESFDPAAQSITGNDINSEALTSPSSMQESPEDKTSSVAKSVPCGNEVVKGDTLPYAMLRPIVVPISRRSSRSDIKGGHDHRSPCVSSTRDIPLPRRPPSPVVLSVPRMPRPPPPSPAGESRKRGFPIVRSGSSSPRHWGMRGLFSEDKIFHRAQFCLDGPEVVWPSWGNKGTSSGTLVQSIEDTVLQDHLVKISQLSRDQHPDVALPVQPPDMLNGSSHKASLSLMHNVLHEEIDQFCKQEPIKEAGILEGRNGIKETCLQHAARCLTNQDWVRSDSLKTVENTAIPVIMLVADVPCDTNTFNEYSSVLDSSQEYSVNVLGEQGSPPRSDTSSSEGSNMLVSSKLNKDDCDIVQSIRLDISFKSSSHTGLQTTELVRQLTQQFPAVVPLALILKKFLADRSLDHPYSGGLSSYCLVLLIVRFLQHEHHLGRPINQNLGSLLMDFLYFFGIDPIHIDDPLCPANNVGRNCFRIHQCIKAFADAFAVLENELSQFSSECSMPASSFYILKKIIPSIDSDEL
nr:unnamed protein product [Digitaria exilis]